MRSLEPSGSRDGQYPILRACHVIFAGSSIDRNVHYTLNNCALSQSPQAQAVAMGNIQPSVRVTLYMPVHQSTGILNYTLNIMPCACFSRTPSRSAVSSLRYVGLLGPLNVQERPDNVSCLCAFQSPVVINPIQPQVRFTVSVHITHSIIHRMSFVLCALQAIAPMQVHGKVYGDHGANNRPLGPDGKRDWTYGLLGCFDRLGLCTSNGPTRATFYILTDFSLSSPLYRRLLGHLVPVCCL